MVVVFIVSNPNLILLFLKFKIKLFSSYILKFLYGGSSLMAELKTVDLVERVQFPPIALNLGGYFHHY